MAKRRTSSLKTEAPKDSRVRTGKPGRPAKSKTGGDKNAGGRDQYFSRAVGKALEVLELLQGESGPMTINEVSQRIQLSKTSAFRLLKTLQALGSVTMDGRGQYKLASGIHAVTPTQWLSKLLRTANPHLRALSSELGETVSLAALFDNRIEVVDVIESTHVIRMSNVIGHILPPNASSLGKAITAFQPPAIREKLLRSFGTYSFTKHTITDQKDLNQEYEQIQLNKFAVDREECAYDGICFCVPVFGNNGNVSAAISMSMPKTRLRDREHEEQIITLLREASAELSAGLQNV
ncbi:MAG: IclR family transcriptional regulator [Acidobacteria bacterium]|nr:IclR family transcriptional regulator [Acidobacteriota bacterium]